MPRTTSVCSLCSKSDGCVEKESAAKSERPGQALNLQQKLHHLASMQVGAPTRRRHTTMPRLHHIDQSLRCITHFRYRRHRHALKRKHSRSALVSIARAT